MRFLIIDDEPIAHRIIEGYSTELPYLQKVGNAYNAFEASAVLNKTSVDLIFLDINMPKMTGFEWLKTLATRPKIIVTTAYQEHALEGYELDVVDYLLKPFSFARFLKAVNKAQRSDSVAPSLEPAPKGERFFLKGDRKHHQIHTDDILFIEAHGNYAKVYLENEMILSHEKISSFEELLPSNQFLRVHKSFLIARARIEQISGNRIFIDQHEIPIGQTYRSTINRLIGRK